MVQDTDLASANSIALEAASALLGGEGHPPPDVAVILGSGWSGALKLLGQEIASTRAPRIPGFFPKSIPGHHGTIVSLLPAEGPSVMAISSRTHLYEGKGIHAVAHPVRVAAHCGAKTIVLTNGAGGLVQEWSPGQPVLISDHINLTASTPVVGATFLDLTDLYSKRLRTIARGIDPTLQEGIYVQFKGPNYETPAEVQMARAIGGHMVGMSTAVEAIAARESGMEVLGLSLITNMAAGISPHPLSHQEVLEAGALAEPAVSELLSRIILSL